MEIICLFRMRKPDVVGKHLLKGISIHRPSSYKFMLKEEVKATET